MSELDPRKQRILQAIVIEYVSAAEPISSEIIVQRLDLGVKSATVRNEMSEMSELGYLEQPHTSAGRVPSDLGYRFYVDRLSHERPVTDDEAQSITRASKEGVALNTLLQDSLRSLSRITHLLSVATTTRDLGVTVKTAILSALGPRQALLVLVLSNGHVENKLVESPDELTIADVGKTNEILNAQVSGKDLRTLTKSKSPTAPGNAVLEGFLVNIWSHVRSMAKALTRGRLITEGEEYLFAQPEFRRDAGALAELFHELNESDLLYDVVSPTTEVVTIGKENRSERFHQFSVIRRAYSVGENEVGVIALVGPTRMQYDRGIPLVQFTADALSDSLSKFFG